MKVKKLLKVLYNGEYVIKTDYGTTLERGFSGVKCDTTSCYGKRQVKSVEVGRNYVINIIIEERKDKEDATNI